MTYDFDHTVQNATADRPSLGCMSPLLCGRMDTRGNLWPVPPHCALCNVNTRTLCCVQMVRLHAFTPGAYRVYYAHQMAWLYHLTCVITCLLFFTTSSWCHQVMLNCFDPNCLQCHCQFPFAAAPCTSTSQCHCHFSFYSSCFCPFNVPPLSWSHFCPADADPPKPGVNFGGSLASPRDPSAQHRCN